MAPQLHSSTDPQIHSYESVAQQKLELKQHFMKNLSQETKQHPDKGTWTRTGEAQCFKRTHLEEPFIMGGDQPEPQQQTHRAELSGSPLRKTFPRYELF